MSCILTGLLVATLAPIGANGASASPAPAQSEPPAAVMTIAPEADTYVSATQPDANNGGADFFDTFGGTSSGCVPLGNPAGPAYGLLRFDLSAIPAGSTINDVRLVTTTRAGWAQNGDGNHHAIFLADDDWAESSVTWNTRPVDGTAAAGDPQLETGGDIRSSPLALGSAFVWRDTCGSDFAGNQTKVFPTNDQDAHKSSAASESDFITRVMAERAGDGKLSIELYNPRCDDCLTPGTAYWARYWSREAADPAVRPRLEITLGNDNDAWTRAEPITLDSGGNGSARGSIDVLGQARWYRFPIEPGTRAHVDVTNLPANYDVAVFTDIYAAFQASRILDTTDDLQRLSAEFAGDAFSPSVFSPSVFSPSVFSPSVFSPSVFSPSVFSPSVFSPSVFSPSVFSPSVFSPSVFSPSVFSPSVFSPSVFSDGEKYVSAQVRSLIAVSASDGTADEHVGVNTWNNTGEMYVRVAGRNGAHAPRSDFDVAVHVDAGTCTGVAPSTQPLLTTGPSSGLRTLILADYRRMDGSLAAMQDRLAALASAEDGEIIDLGATSRRVAALNDQADTKPGCPYAKNLVAEAIRDIVAAYRAVDPELASIVIVGADDVIPFFRYPDTAGIGPESGYVPPVLDASASQASLRLNYFLSQDAYGAAVQVPRQGLTVPVPDLPVGRLVETPDEITGLVDAFLADRVLEPATALVTGYDFLADAADRVTSTFQAGLGATAVDALITRQGIAPTDVGAPPDHSWTADQLRAQLLGARHDLVYLAGHFSANNLLAADSQSTINATELAQSDVDLSGSVVLSAGCHSGYTVVDRDAVPNVTQQLDWVQALAHKRATVIAGTGYQYGDTDFLEYSERLYGDLADALRAGTGPVGIGAALVAAKQQYLEATPSLGGIHQKALLEATLYGLPMAAVDLPAGRMPPSDDSSIVPSTTAVTTDPGRTLRLSYADVSRSPSVERHAKELVDPDGAPTGVTATWLTVGTEGFLTNPGAPALPLETNDVTVPGQVLRGVGFRGGSFTDTSGVTPLTGAPATELNSPHTAFVSSAFYPARLWSVNYFGGLQGDGPETKLMLTPAQYRSDAPGSLTDVERQFSSATLRLFYSDYVTSFPGGSPALAAPPTIARVDADVDGADVEFRIHAVGEPAAGMQQVWVTYTGVTAGQWESLDLAQDPVDSTLWTGTLHGVTPSEIEFLVQAANGVGLVGVDDNLGALYRPGQIPPAIQIAPQPLPPTSLALTAPAAVPYGSVVPVSATLTDGPAPLAGEPVQFSIGGTAFSVVTDSNGVATVDVPVLTPPGAADLRAAFGGSPTHASSSAAQPLTVTKLPTTLTLAAATAPVVGGDTGIAATLTTSSNAPVADRTILFRVTPANGPPVVVARTTGFRGQAALGAVSMPNGQPLSPGTYTVDASFGSNPALGFAVPDDAIYEPSSATLAGTLTVARPLLFASTRTGNGDIYAVDPAGGPPVQLTSDPAVDAEPEWSPSGDRVVFTSTRGGNVDVYVMDRDGTDVTRLTDDRAIDTSPAWSPDGQRIAFASNRGPGGNWDIYVMAADGSNVQRLTTNRGADLLPAWSPAGDRLAFTSTRSGNGDIYTMNADGSSPTRLTTSFAVDTDPAWSGTTIAFSTNRDGLLNFEIYTMPDTGGALTRVTRNAGLDIMPAWSSDGSTIAFASSATWWLDLDIVTARPDGSAGSPLVVDPAVDLFPAW